MRLPALMALVAALLLAAESPREETARRDVPDKLMPPREQVVQVQLQATGVQIYKCQGRADQPGQLAWVFQAPEADLLDATGKKIGKHYAGPTWEAEDGSKVVAKVMEKAPAPKDGDIPWLLLKASANEGSGLFGKVEYVQRLYTEGGSPPAQADKAQEGKEVRVNYKATYVFFTTKK